MVSLRQKSLSGATRPVFMQTIKGGVRLRPGAATRAAPALPARRDLHDRTVQPCVDAGIALWRLILIVEPQGLVAKRGRRIEAPQSSVDVVSQHHPRVFDCATAAVLIRHSSAAAQSPVETCRSKGCAFRLDVVAFGWTARPQDGSAIQDEFVDAAGSSWPNSRHQVTNT